MGESEIFEVLRASLWTGVLMGLPILGVTLVLGFCHWPGSGADLGAGNDADLCSEDCRSRRRLLPLYRIHDAGLPGSIQQNDHPIDFGVRRRCQT